MTSLQIHIENHALSRTLIELLGTIEGIQITHIDSMPLSQGASQENQALWNEILGILAELPTEYLPTLLEVLQGFYAPILEKYRMEYQEFEQEELTLAEAGVQEWAELLKKEDNL